MITELHQLTDTDAKIVMAKIAELMKRGAHDAEHGSPLGFHVYRTCRDIMEYFSLDQASRDMLKKLQDNPDVFQGYTVSEAVKGHLANSRLILAIKEFRSETGLELKEAKDWVEALRNHKNYPR